LCIQVMNRLLVGVLGTLTMALKLPVNNETYSLPSGSNLRKAA